LIVAIDGPAGSGKSTTAKALAERLGYLYLDTGAMYRSVALLFLRADVEPTEDQAARLLDGSSIEIRAREGRTIVSLNGEDVTDEIRTPSVTALSSIVSTLSVVRERLVADQRRIARSANSPSGGVILEGRDIGTVVLPDADVKIYLDADPVERARRRREELPVEAGRPDVRSIEDQLRARDERDRNRTHSPLRIADDAIVVDTTELTFEEQIDRIAKIIREQKHRDAIHK
jgi:cytidylate kinase